MKLKVGVFMMLLINLDIVATELGGLLQRWEVCSGRNGYIRKKRNIREKVYIPRLSLTHSNPLIPYRFQHIQFSMFVLQTKVKDNHLSKLTYIFHN